MTFANGVLPQVLNDNSGRIDAVVIQRDVILRPGGCRTRHQSSRADVAEVDINRDRRNNSATGYHKRLHHKRLLEAPWVTEVIECALHVGDDRRYQVSR